MEAFKKYNLSYFANVVIDDVLIIYYNKLENGAEIKIYNEMSKSPYRNYISRELPEGENVLYFMIIDNELTIKKLYAELQQEDWAASYRLVSYASSDYPGYWYIKIYHHDANWRHMLEHLKSMQHLNQSILLGKDPATCDVIIPGTDQNAMVRKLKKLYKPVSFKRFG